MDAVSDILLRVDSEFKNFLKRTVVAQGNKQNSGLAWHNRGTLYAMKHPGLEGLGLMPESVGKGCRARL
jgi:glucose/arabinose dehydrogenase